MKGLPKFLVFNAAEFLREKTLQFVQHSVWIDFNTKEVLGYKYRLIILDDETDYGNSDIDNSGEKLEVKVRGTHIPLTKRDIVQLVNPKAKVYGDRREQLSIEADDITVID